MHNKRIFYTVVLLLFLALLFQSSIFLQEILREFTGSLIGFEEFNPRSAMILFVLFASLSVLAGPFSSFPLVPPAVLIWGLPMTLVLLYLGWLMGNCIAYFIGRFFGRFLVDKIVGEAKVGNWINSLKAKLTFFYLLLFRIATPSETGYAFGVIHYDFAKYLIISMLAELPFVLLMVYAGEAFTRSSTYALISLVWIWAIIIFLALYFFRKASKR